MKQLPECQLILDQLKNKLPEHIQYHNVQHTLDVYDCAEKLAKEEGISASDLKLLLVAAIYHDSGFLVENADHEQHSCELAKKYLPQFHYTKKDIATICNCIMATKIPQEPQSLLQEIICDADLDYLGRTDFFSIGDRLYEEMLAIGTIGSRKEWDEMQVYFLQQHRFFTATAKRLRQKQKEKNLEMVQSKIKSI